MKKFLLLLIILLILAMLFLPGLLIKQGVEQVGSQLLKTDVTLGGARLNLFSGTLGLENLNVGNPEGFTSDSAVSLGKLNVSLAPKSLLSDTIQVTEVAIDAPVITVEINQKGLNLSALQKNLETRKGKSGTGTDVTQEGDHGGEGKQLIIDRFVLSGATLRVVNTLVPGGSAEKFTLPTIEIRDIGKNRGGASYEEVIRTVAAAVSKHFPDQAGLGALKGVADGVLDQVKELKENIGNNAGKVGESLKKMLGQ